MGRVTMNSPGRNTRWSLEFRMGRTQASHTNYFPVPSEAFFLQATTHFSHVCNECNTFQLAEGDLLFKKGDLAEHAHVILKGVLRMVTASPKGSDRLTEFLGPGDIVGAACIEGYEVYPESAVAATEVQLMPLDVPYGMRFENTRSAIATALVHQLNRNRKFADDLGLPMNARIYRIISRLTLRLGTPLHNGWYRLGFQLRHDDIAMLAGCARITVTRVLGDLKERGVLDGARGRYNIRPQPLDELIDIQVFESI